MSTRVLMVNPQAGFRPSSSYPLYLVTRIPENHIQQPDVVHGARPGFPEFELSFDAGFPGFDSPRPNINALLLIAFFEDIRKYPSLTYADGSQILLHAIYCLLPASSRHKHPNSFGTLDSWIFSAPSTRCSLTFSKNEPCTTLGCGVRNTTRSNRRKQETPAGHSRFDSPHPNTESLGFPFAVREIGLLVFSSTPSTLMRVQPTLAFITPFLRFSPLD
ncbi:hypothetical protein DFH08DRAFT_960855 [Mycena albidolilacea]|uniref:Uncharacterized protein n=1 Tax=Mycena albidolilacea TaxID=1033008 RepID=A0AAD7A2E4_9AGAR|nr:hypothetical protein DFH08DRAFT_960855 [Mycena albidolilacea]